MTDGGDFNKDFGQRLSDNADRDVGPHNVENSSIAYWCKQRGKKQKSAPKGACLLAYWRRGRDSPKSTNLQRRNPELTVQSYTVWFTELMMAGW